MDVWTRLVSRAQLIGLLGLIATGAGAWAYNAATATLTRSTEQDREALVHVNGHACGVERWSVKTGIDADARRVNTKHVVATSIAHLRGLPYPRTLPAHARIRPTELTVFRISATLVRYRAEADSDVHLVLADSGLRTMISEIPASYCVGSHSPFAHQITSTRAAFNRRFHPSDRWQRPNTRVTVTGVAFYDYRHGQSGVAPNAIELHPILSLKTGN